MVVPFAAGGSSDVVGRLIGSKMAATLRQNIVIDNRAGAGGMIGADIVAKAAPDGYTLLYANTSISTNPSLFKALPYDTLDQVRSRLVTVNKVFAALDHQAPGAWGEFGAAGSVSDAPFASPIENFYMTDPISRASKTMADCRASRHQLMAAE